MTGWEATAEAGHQDEALGETYQFPSSTFALYKAALLAGMLDLGNNRARVEFRFDDVNASGYAWTSPFYPAIKPSTALPGQWHFDRPSNFMSALGTDWRAALAARGEKLYINLCFVDFDNNGYRLEDDVNEFAFLVNKVVAWFYSTYGYLPDSLEVLEPDNSSGNQNWTAAKLANCIVAANTLLVSNGYSGIKWCAPTSTTLANVNSWIAAMKSANPAVTALISEYSYHLYGGTDADLATLRATALADGKTTAMLESHAGFGGLSADIHRLYKDLTIGYGSSWQQFTLAYPYPSATDDGGKYFLVDTSNWAVTLSSRAKYLRHYFKYVRRGAVMKSVTNSSGSYQGLPFVNKNSRYAVPIKCAAAGAIDVVGLPAGTYEIRYTLGDGVNAPSAFDQALPNQTITNGQNVSFTMPGAGVVTVFDTNYAQSSVVYYFGSQPSPV